ncbi:MFS transporter [Curtobacterium sp. S6]|uniref:MFS transporter n=1 Tax=Curtobacterium sp. S6 TaxID=1479623 RepID=UPI000AEEBF3E
MPNYRWWFIGALISNVGTWMQRIAQDWLVFNDLSHEDSTAMGIVMALQFLPQLVLAPYAGLIADRADRRKVLYVTQGSMAVLAGLLGALVLSGAAQLWHVYVFALLLGVVTAIDSPVRQTFVSNLVSDRDLPNAVALNSMSFNSARMVGPAIAGILVAAMGSGPVFLINTVTFLAMIGAIAVINTSRLRPMPRVSKAGSRMRDGLTYVKSRPDILVVMVGAFLVGTFGMNSAINIAAMATSEFGYGANQFGFLSSTMAIGSVAGTLMAAKRERPRLRFIFGASGAFGLSCLAAALSPNVVVFAVILVPMGLAALTFITSANAYVQVSTEPQMRGRVMSIYMAVFMGGTPIGAPIVGVINDVMGARWGLGVAVVAGIVTAGLGLVWYWRSQDLHLTFDRSRRGFVRLEKDADYSPITAALEIQEPR